MVSLFMGKAQAISYWVYLLFVFAFIVNGEPGGFMNIDCGKPRGYNGFDSITRLTYVSDYEYIDTGVTHSISSTFQGSDVSLQTNDLRSFPNGTRNCYTFTIDSPGKKYLIRASFLYGNYDGKNYFPKFDLYLGTIYWETISISSSSVTYDTTIYSIASCSYLFVCLIDIGSGTPFISSIELRPLDDDVYSLKINASNRVSLVSVDLVNFGKSGDPVVRYPNDAYDRVWRSYGEPGWTKLYTRSNVQVDNHFYPPVVVMQTAVAPTSGSTLNFSTMLGDSSLDTLYHVFLHFAEIQDLNENDIRVFSVSRNGIVIYNDEKPQRLWTFTIYTPYPDRFEMLEHFLYMTNGSTLPPMINAIEVYKVRDMQQVTTNIEDAEAIIDVKAFYHIRKNWTGDPCAPREFNWDGLACSYGDSPRIKALNLKDSELTGPFEFSICDLTELQELDLSTNQLSGPIPSCLANLQQLTLLNLTNSGLKGPVPKALGDRTRDGSLQLSFEDNPTSTPGTLYQSGIPVVEREKKSNVIVIAIAAPFSIALLVLIALGVFWKTRSDRHDEQNGSLLRTQSYENGLSPNDSDCRQFTYSELAKVTDNFSQIIGKGGFGSVYYGFLQNEVQVAVKMLSTESCQGPKEFQREAQLLRRIHHRNLVHFVGYCNDNDHLALVYEYMAQGNLATHLSGLLHPLCWKDRIRIAYEAALGLEYLHKRCSPTIIHRDIKTSNILLDQNLEAKIADFGLSKSCKNGNYTQVTTAVMGTHGYLDPFSIALDQRSDVYAFGVVLLELITGKPAIIHEGSETIYLTEWVKEHCKKREIERIMDKRLQGDYNLDMLRKVFETALACVSSNTDGRPDMTVVSAILNNCLEMESVNVTISSNSNTTASRNLTSGFFLPGNDSIEIGPYAR